MAMEADQVLAHPALGTCVRRQAAALMQLHQASPRLASPFATQQRWLMSQAALAQYFRNEAAAAGSGLLAQRVVDIALRRGLASRNTAAAFISEMLKYDIVRHIAGSAGKRARPFEPSPRTLVMLLHWLALHLATLDALDGGQRSAALAAQPALLPMIQPLIADGLLASREVRKPSRTFSLFTWVNDGGVVMDRLIAGCRPQEDETQDDETRVGDSDAVLGRVTTDVTAVSALALRLNLSRTQLGRKLAAAEAMGSLGWSGRRGRSPLWVSDGFRHEYHRAQSVKLAIIDAAFEACFEGEHDLVISDAVSA
ncbi:hypothetical protein [Bosea sp. 685]|uniref:hypothetical protein n=1 Tax=Bosea sp. 685 TaxID=3080057 RepID=UPI002892A227|nr:hypothetical protein [Bosea sp. 685]WNJ88101.1 hypothetical protein RMR04_16905 [Bosea sp. 685]